MARASPKLGAVDLNLLAVFDAVMQERSVTRAGTRLGLSQPAMSHALARLRHMLKDELFVRSPKGMMPTPRAEQLAGPVRAALEDFSRRLNRPSSSLPPQRKRFALRSTITRRWSWWALWSQRSSRLHLM